MHYQNGKGKDVKWRMGSWIARTETKSRREELERQLKRYGLAEHWPDVQTYLDEADKVMQRYGPLLLTTGMVPVRACDLPAGPLADRWDTLSFVTVDSGGASRLGVHVDTDQLYPCLCSCDSLYPPGYYDVRGGGLTLVDGVWVEEYGRRSAVLLAGHTATHTLLPLSQEEGEKRRMLRASIVHWSHVGKELVERHDELIAREVELPDMCMEYAGEAADEGPSDVASGGDM